MYLSKLILNPRSRQVQKELADPYQLHRTVMSGFPKTLPLGERVLHRLDIHQHTGQFMLLVQSQSAPDWTSLREKDYLLTAPQFKSISVRVHPGQFLSFRLHANPTIKTRSKQDPSRKTRVPLVYEDQQMDWLARKGDQHGFKVRKIQVMTIGRQQGWIRHAEGKQHLQIYVVRFEGILQVTAPDLFLLALHNGIGPAKSFGCGLLSLAQLR